MPGRRFFTVMWNEVGNAATRCIVRGSREWFLANGRCGIHQVMYHTCGGGLSLTT
jgi:hypothetical protein